MNTKIVEQLCGQYPTDFEKTEIISNSDYIFLNDPLYPPVTLLDNEQNIVTVNSFLECEHYVMGGWDYMPAIASESGYHILIFGIVLSIIFGQFVYEKYRKSKLI